MKFAKMTIASALAAVLTACGGSETPASDQNEGAAPAGAISDMTPAAGKAALQGKGAGTVTSIDAKAGTITLDHGPIPEVNWPAMAMAFKAAPSVLEKARVGDEVDFEFIVDGGESEITAMTKK